MKNKETCCDCKREFPPLPYYCEECIEKRMKKAERELKARSKKVKND